MLYIFHLFMSKNGIFEMHKKKRKCTKKNANAQKKMQMHKKKKII
jgi:hypothetical protein